MNPALSEKSDARRQLLVCRKLDEGCSNLPNIAKHFVGAVE